MDLARTEFAGFVRRRAPARRLPIEPPNERVCRRAGRRSWAELPDDQNFFLRWPLAGRIYSSEDSCLSATANNRGLKGRPVAAKVIPLWRLTTLISVRTAVHCGLPEADPTVFIKGWPHAAACLGDHP